MNRNEQGRSRYKRRNAGEYGNDIRHPEEPRRTPMAGNQAIAPVEELQNEANDYEVRQSDDGGIHQVRTVLRNERHDLPGVAAGDETEVGRDDRLVAQQVFEPIGYREHHHDGAEDGGGHPEAVQERDDDQIHQTYNQEIQQELPLVLQPHLADELRQLPGHGAYDPCSVVDLRIVGIFNRVVYAPLQEQYRSGCYDGEYYGVQRIRQFGTLAPHGADAVADAFEDLNCGVRAFPRCRFGLFGWRWRFGLWLRFGVHIVCNARIVGCLEFVFVAVQECVEARELFPAFGDVGCPPLVPVTA